MALMERDPDKALLGSKLIWAVCRLLFIAFIMLIAFVAIHHWRLSLRDPQLYTIEAMYLPIDSEHDFGLQILKVSNRRVMHRIGAGIFVREEDVKNIEQIFDYLELERKRSIIASYCLSGYLYLHSESFPILPTAGLYQFSPTRMVPGACSAKMRLYEKRS